MLNKNPPAWSISSWLNTPLPLSLDHFKGKVVAMEAFQMLCPGCTLHGLPQLNRIAGAFNNSDVAVVGLHCVFEHKEAQGNEAVLSAYLHEYKFTFPVGIDKQQTQNGIPQTMADYRIEGTPTLLLFDKKGRLRHQYLGTQPDMKIGAEIATLIAEQLAD